MGTSGIETYKADNAPRDAAQLMALRGPQRYYLALNVCGKIGEGLKSTEDGLAFRALDAGEQVNLIMGWLAQYDAANGGQPVQTARASTPGRRPEPEPPARDPRQLELPAAPAPVPRTPVVEPTPPAAAERQHQVRGEVVIGGAATIGEAVNAIARGVESMNRAVESLTKAQEDTTLVVAALEERISALSSAVLGNMQLLQVIAGYMRLTSEHVLKQEGLEPDAIVGELRMCELETGKLGELLAALGAKQTGQ